MRNHLTRVMLLAFLRVLLLVLCLFILPLAAHAVWWASRGDVAPSWRAADWSSARLLPTPAAEPRPIVAIYVARVGRWRGIFAHHSWVVVKEAGGSRYTRYDKVGWGSPVRTDGWPPDGRWFGNAPQPIVFIAGDEAARIIPKIRAAVASYPYRSWGDYHAWPGPNSNTFVAYVMRAVPGIGAILPPVAVGRDYPADGRLVSVDPDRRDVRVSLWGYAGLAAGLKTGFEINFLGLVAGIDPWRLGLKIPAFGTYALLGR